MITTEVRTIRFADADLAGEKWRFIVIRPDARVQRYGVSLLAAEPWPLAAEEILTILKRPAEQTLIENPFRMRSTIEPKKSKSQN